MLAKNKDCTGCMACVSVCENNAISIVKDVIFGHLKPKINESTCLNCGKCRLICPIINNPKFNSSQACYAAYSFDKIAYDYSSSGGVAYELAKNFILNDGVVFGAAFVDNCSIAHIKIDSIDKLKKISGSKYAQSNTFECYKELKGVLAANKVLFIGTPCQVAGIINYIPKKLTGNLYTIDLFCHGVPSQELLKHEVNKLTDAKNIKNITFRDNKDHDKYIMKIFSKNNNNITISNKDSLYIKCFLKTLTLRESCYNCIFAKKERIGDISLGDFWGISESSKIKAEKQNGISAVLVNTIKGKHLFNEIINNIRYEERNIEECINGNDRLRSPNEKTKKVEKFQKAWVKTKSLKKSYKNTFPIKYLLRKY